MTHPELPTATAGDFARWILRRRRRVRVVGPSMEPTLLAGQVVFVDTSAYKADRPVDLDIVVAHHPQRPGVEVLKRVEFTTDEGAYLKSDNADARSVEDSRRFGVVPFELITGRVVSRVEGSSSQPNA